MDGYVRRTIFEARVLATYGLGLGAARGGNAGVIGTARNGDTQVSGDVMLRSMGFL